MDKPQIFRILISNDRYADAKQELIPFKNQIDSPFKTGFKFGFGFWLSMILVYAILLLTMLIFTGFSLRKLFF